MKCWEWCTNTPNKKEGVRFGFKNQVEDCISSESIVISTRYLLTFGKPNTILVPCVEVVERQRREELQFLKHLTLSVC